MKIERRHLLALAGTSALLWACKGDRPPILPPSVTRQRLLRSGAFRLGVLDFGLPGEERGGATDVKLAKAIPAVLATELKAAGRFAVHEGGGIRVGGGALSEDGARKYVDGYLSGTITSDSNAEACFDFRISNAFTHEVLYAKSACVPVKREGSTITPDRPAVKRIADEATRAIKEVGNAKVTSVDGKLVFVDKGADADILPGMVATIVATGDASQNPSRHTQVQAITKVNPDAFNTAKVPVIVGEIAIVSVEEKYAAGVLYNGDYALPGDTAFFK